MLPLVVHPQFHKHPVNRVSGDSHASLLQLVSGARLGTQSCYKASLNVWVRQLLAEGLQIVATALVVFSGLAIRRSAWGRPRGTRYRSRPGAKVGPRTRPKCLRFLGVIDDIYRLGEIGGGPYRQPSGCPVLRA